MRVGVRPHVVEIVVGAESGEVLGRGVDLGVTAVGDADLAFLGALGGDEDDAVGAACAVDGGGGGVLEDVDGLNLVGRDVGEGAGGAVDEDERVIALGDGAATANTDVHLCARAAVLRDDVDAGELALDGLRDVGDRSGGELLGVDGSDGSCEVAALDGLVTDDDGLVEEECILIEDEVDRGLVGEAYFLRGVADAGGLEDGVRGNAEGVVAVEVCDGTDGGAADDDAGSDDGFAVGVLDGSRNLVLGEGEGAAHEEHEPCDHHAEMILHHLGNLVKQ